MKAIETIAQPSGETWQSRFVSMLPALEQRLEASFRNLQEECREDATQEAIVHCLVSYYRLACRGREHVATVFSLTRFAALQIRRGRSAVGHLNSKDPLSRYARYTAAFKVLPLR